MLHIYEFNNEYIIEKMGLRTNFLQSLEKSGNKLIGRFYEGFSDDFPVLA